LNSNKLTVAFLVHVVGAHAVLALRRDVQLATLVIENCHLLEAEMNTTIDHHRLELLPPAELHLQTKPNFTGCTRTSALSRSVREVLANPTSGSISRPHDSKTNGLNSTTWYYPITACLSPPIRAEWPGGDPLCGGRTEEYDVNHNASRNELKTQLP